MRNPRISVVVALASVAAAQSPAADVGRPTLFVTGDSTASSGDRLRWSDPFAAYFNPSTISVIHGAPAGRSPRTFLNEGLWDKLLTGMTSGDYTLIQFGHNNAGKNGRGAGPAAPSNRPHARGGGARFSVATFAVARESDGSHNLSDRRLDGPQRVRAELNPSMVAAGIPALKEIPMAQFLSEP